MKTQKIIIRFISHILFFGILINAATATAAFGSQLSSAESVTIKNLSDVTIVTFDPKINKARIFAAKEQGFPEGANVDEIFGTTDAFVVMNAGFFSEGKYRRPGKVGKAIERICYYTGVSKTYAFPSAILMVDNKLLSDTGDYLPALGINDGGEIKMGEVKVVWSVQLSTDGKKILLDRISDIDPDNANTFIYCNFGPSNIMEVSISNKMVTKIKEVKEGEVTKMANSYRLHEPSQEIIDKFLALHVGDYLSCSYELDAAAYPEQGGIKTREKDEDLSAFFNKSSYVVSGGQLLIYQGNEDLRISTVYPGRGDQPYEKFGTVVCLHKNGLVSLIVIESGRMFKDDILQLLKDLQCEYAISLDGGRSTQLITMINGDKTIYGKNRVVSDIIAVMPKEYRRQG